MKMEERFAELWQRMSAKGDANKAFKLLAEGYSLPHPDRRAYHNLDHVAYCLEQLDQVRSLLDAPDSVEFAVWFHDLVYLTHPAHAMLNEERSAAAAVLAASQAGISDERLGVILGLVMATKHGRFVPVSNDEKFIADIDLLSLAKPWEEFLSDGKKIRQEYDHIPDDIFFTGRAALFRKLLSEGIYHTKFFQDEAGRSAHDNLNSWLEEYGDKV